MSKRGPKPKPTKLRVFEGNPGKLPICANEVDPESAVLKAVLKACPSYLGRAGRKVWRDTAKILHPLGLLTVADLGSFGLYCAAWDEFEEAKKDIKTNGLLVEGAGGAQIRNPAIMVVQSSRQAIRQFGALFGLSPVDRIGMSIEVSDRPTEPDDLKRGLL